MAFNKSELILDRVRSLVANDLSTGKMLFRLTNLEDPSLSCTAEGEEVTDAIGALITTLYRAKRATFSATNSLISLDLAAAQYGTTKVQGSVSSKIDDYTYDILKVPAEDWTYTEVSTPTGNPSTSNYFEKNGSVYSASEDTTVDNTKTYYTRAKVVQLRHTPKDASNIKWAYSIVDGEIGTAYAAGSVASATEFVVANDGTITVPTGFTGKLYIEYVYENANAVRITNKASEFPSACALTIYAYFKDRCDENTTYSGKIICPKAKLNPEQVELALTSTGKHSFEFVMMKDYCAEEGEDELFSIIVSA